MRATFKDNAFRKLSQVKSPGKTSEVYKVRALEESGKIRKGAIVALKEYKKGIFTNENQVDNIFKELDTGQLIESERIVKTLGYFYDFDLEIVQKEVWINQFNLKSGNYRIQFSEFERTSKWRELCALKEFFKVLNNIIREYPEASSELPKDLTDELIKKFDELWNSV